MGGCTELPHGNAVPRRPACLHGPAGRLRGDGAQSCQPVRPAGRRRLALLRVAEVGPAMDRVSMGRGLLSRSFLQADERRHDADESLHRHVDV